MHSTAVSDGNAMSTIIDVATISHEKIGMRHIVIPGVR